MKTKIQRMREVKRLMEQLESVGLGPHVISVQEFSTIADAFIQNGINQTGIIRLPFETERILVYELINKTNKASNIIIKYIGGTQ